MSTRGPSRSRSKSKSRTRSIRSKKGEEDRLVPKNFEKFVWKDLERLNVEDIQNEVKTKMVVKCALTLTTIEFTGILLFKNFKIIIGSCSELQTLILSDISLSHYSAEQHEDSKDSSSSSDLKTKINKIVFNGLGKLTLHELHILNFMHDKVSFSGLRVMSFITQRSNCSTSISKSNLFDPNVNETILALFLNKNWSGLKSLEVNRTDITLYDDQNVQSPKIVNIQLEKFECDMSAVGFEKVLNSQTELQILNCYNKNLRSSGIDVLLNSLHRCGETLKDIRISYNVMTSNAVLDEDENGSPKPINHDFKVYKYCKKLRKLSVTVSRVVEPEYPGSFKIRPGGIQNAQYIPFSTLKILLIRCDIIEDKEMKAFAAVFPSFEMLRQLIVHGNQDTPYKLKTSWVLTLVELPKMLNFEFRNCKIDDLKSFEAFRKSLPGLRARLKVSTDMCVYWKNAKKFKSKSTIVAKRSQQ